LKNLSIFLYLPGDKCNDATCGTRSTCANIPNSPFYKFLILIFFLDRDECGYATCGTRSTCADSSSNILIGPDTFRYKEGRKKWEERGQAGKGVQGRGKGRKRGVKGERGRREEQK
jgi:hypothetical protein